MAFILVKGYTAKNYPEPNFPYFSGNYAPQNPKPGLVIVGGDFNSFTKASVKAVEKEYNQAGFTRASKGNPFSVIKLGMKLSTDPIFTKGFVVQGAGNLAEATASDRLPVWVTLTWK